jgi:hypothetical protein
MHKYLQKEMRNEKRKEIKNQRPSRICTDLLSHMHHQ